MKFTTAGHIACLILAWKGLSSSKRLMAPETVLFTLDTTHSSVSDFWGTKMIGGPAENVKLRSKLRNRLTTLDDIGVHQCYEIGLWGYRGHSPDVETLQNTSYITEELPFDFDLVGMLISDISKAHHGVLLEPMEVKLPGTEHYHILRMRAESLLKLLEVQQWLYIAIISTLLLALLPCFDGRRGALLLLAAVGSFVPATLWAVSMDTLESMTSTFMEDFSLEYYKHLIKAAYDSSVTRSIATSTLLAFILPVVCLITTGGYDDL